ncbi:MAG: response regulator, partial [Candidatus Acidiferrales bacterium]
VADGEAALKCAREHRPDLILSDIMMPKLDGFALLRAVRADENLKSIPMILLSARAGEESRVEGLDAGADDYLVKPFSARELRARVGSHLAMARIRREAAELERKLRTEAESQVRERTRELEEKTADVLRQSEQLRELSWRLLHTQDEERRHIARELHDSAGQTLAVLGMMISSVVEMARRKTPEIADSAKEIHEVVQQLTKEIRTTSYLLHPPLLDENGLPPALSWYLRGLTERSGMDIGFYISEEFGRLPRDMERVVFRLVQECLTNVHRHSGSKSAAIRIVRETDRVVIEVRDEGKGISPERLAEIQSKGSGVGIRGMRERLRQFQGEMIIQSPGPGTTVLVTIPLNATASASDPVQPTDSFKPAI